MSLNAMVGVGVGMVCVGIGTGIEGRLGLERAILGVSCLHWHQCLYHESSRPAG